MQPLEEIFIAKANASDSDMGLPATARAEGPRSPSWDPHMRGWEHEHPPANGSLYAAEAPYDDPRIRDNDGCPSDRLLDWYAAADRQPALRDEPGRHALDWRDYDAQHPDSPAGNSSPMDSLPLSGPPHEWSEGPQDYPGHGYMDEEQGWIQDRPCFHGSRRDWDSDGHMTDPSFSQPAQGRSSSSYGMSDGDETYGRQSHEQIYSPQHFSEFVAVTDEQPAQPQSSMCLDQRFSRYPNATAEPRIGTAKVNVKIVPEAPPLEPGQVLEDRTSNEPTHEHRSRMRVPVASSGPQSFTRLENRAESQAIPNIANHAGSLTHPGDALESAKLRKPSLANGATATAAPSGIAANGTNAVGHPNGPGKEHSTAVSLRGARGTQASNPGRSTAVASVQKPPMPSLPAKRKAGIIPAQEQAGPVSQPASDPLEQGVNTSQRVQSQQQKQQDEQLPTEGAAKKPKLDFEKAATQQLPRQLPSQQQPTQPPTAAEAPVAKPADGPSSGKRPRGGQKIQWAAGSATKQTKGSDPLSKSLAQSIEDTKAAGSATKPSKGSDRLSKALAQSIKDTKAAGSAPKQTEGSDPLSKSLAQSIKDTKAAGSAPKQTKGSDPLSKSLAQSMKNTKAAGSAAKKTEGSDPLSKNLGQGVAETKAASSAITQTGGSDPLSKSLAQSIAETKAAGSATKQAKGSDPISKTLAQSIEDTKAQKTGQTAHAPAVEKLSPVLSQPARAVPGPADQIKHSSAFLKLQEVDRSCAEKPTALSDSTATEPTAPQAVRQTAYLGPLAAKDDAVQKLKGSVHGPHAADEREQVSNGPSPAPTGAMRQCGPYYGRTTKGPHQPIKFVRNLQDPSRAGAAQISRKRLYDARSEMADMLVADLTCTKGRTKRQRIRHHLQPEPDAGQAMADNQAAELACPNSRQGRTEAWKNLELLPDDQERSPTVKAVAGGSKPRERGSMAQRSQAGHVFSGQGISPAGRFNGSGTSTVSAGDRQPTPPSRAANNRPLDSSAAPQLSPKDSPADPLNQHTARDRPLPDALAVQADLEAQEAKVRVLRAEAELKSLRARIRSLEAQQHGETASPVPGGSPSHAHPSSTAPHDRIAVPTPDPAHAAPKLSGRVGQDSAPGRTSAAGSAEHGYGQAAAAHAAPLHAPSDGLERAASGKAKCNGNQLQVTDGHGSSAAAGQAKEEILASRSGGHQPQFLNQPAEAAACRDDSAPSEPSLLADQLLSSLGGADQLLPAMAGQATRQPARRSHSPQKGADQTVEPGTKLPVTAGSSPAGDADALVGLPSLTETPSGSRAMQHPDYRANLPAAMSMHDMAALQQTNEGHGKTDAATVSLETTGMKPRDDEIPGQPIGAGMSIPDPHTIMADAPGDAFAAGNDAEWVIDAGDFDGSGLQRAGSMDSQGDVDIGC